MWTQNGNTYTATLSDGRIARIVKANGKYYCYIAGTMLPVSPKALSVAKKWIVEYANKVK